jgi:hypothetical protein
LGFCITNRAYSLHSNNVLRLQPRVRAFVADLSDPYGLTGEGGKGNGGANYLASAF